MELLRELLVKLHVGPTHFAGLLVIGFVLILAFFRGRREPSPVFDPKAEWFRLCKRMGDAAKDYVGGRLDVAVTEREPYGGEVRVTREFSDRSEPVIAVRFASTQPADTLRLAEKQGDDEEWRSLYLSLDEFGGFLDHLEEVIGKYTSPNQVA